MDFRGFVILLGFLAVACAKVPPAAEPSQENPTEETLQPIVDNPIVSDDSRKTVTSGDVAKVAVPVVGLGGMAFLFLLNDKIKDPLGSKKDKPTNAALVNDDESSGDLKVKTEEKEEEKTAESNHGNYEDLPESLKDWYSNEQMDWEKERNLKSFWTYLTKDQIEKLDQLPPKDKEVFSRLDKTKQTQFLSFNENERDALEKDPYPGASILFESTPEDRVKKHTLIQEAAKNKGKNTKLSEEDKQLCYAKFSYEECETYIKLNKNERNKLLGGRGTYKVKEELSQFKTSHKKTAFQYNELIAELLTDPSFKYLDLGNTALKNKNSKEYKCFVSFFGGDDWKENGQLQGFILPALADNTNMGNPYDPWFGASDLKDFWKPICKEQPHVQRNLKDNLSAFLAKLKRLDSRVKVSAVAWVFGKSRVSQMNIFLKQIPKQDQWDKIDKSFFRKSYAENFLFLLARYDEKPGASFWDVLEKISYYENLNDGLKGLIKQTRGKGGEELLGYKAEFNRLVDELMGL